MAIFFLVIVLEVVQGTATSKWATFFTNWTFVAFFIHSAVGIMQSVRGIRRGAKRPEMQGWTWQPYDWLDKLHSIIAVSVITITLHVAIFYWAALYPGSVRTRCLESMESTHCDSRHARSGPSVFNPAHASCMPRQ